MADRSPGRVRWERRHHPSQAAGGLIRGGRDPAAASCPTAVASGPPLPGRQDDPRPSPHGARAMTTGTGETELVMYTPLTVEEIAKAFDCPLCGERGCGHLNRDRMVLKMALELQE